MRPCPVLQADDFQAQLMHGSFRLDVARLINDGMLTWQDTLHPARPRHAGAAEVGSTRGVGAAADSGSRSLTDHIIS